MSVQLFFPEPEIIAGDTLQTRHGPKLIRTLLTRVLKQTAHRVVAVSSRFECANLVPIPQRGIDSSRQSHFWRRHGYEYRADADGRSQVLVQRG